MFIDSRPVAFHHQRANPQRQLQLDIRCERACPKKELPDCMQNSVGKYPCNPERQTSPLPFPFVYHLKRIRPGLSTIGRQKWAKMTVEIGKIATKVLMRHRAGAPMAR